MTGRSYEHISDRELADAWVEAFKAMAKDYKSREARALVDRLVDEIRARGYVPPVERVAHEMAELAAQIRANTAQNTPAAVESVRQNLEADLLAYVAERNSEVPQSRN